jgi:hypothetical protein
MTVNIYKAKPVVGEVPNLEIVAKDEIPELPDTGLPWEGAYRQRFDDEARAVVDALLTCLPGGTIDAILCRLLEHKRSLYRVPHVES